MARQNQKALQAKVDGRWQFVFCRHPLQGMILTDDRRKALPIIAIEYFQLHFGNTEFKGK